MLRIVFRFSVILGLLLPTRADAQPHLVSKNGSAMGTEVRISVFTEDDEGANRAMDEAFEEIQRIESLMTTWHDSEVFRVNTSAGIEPVKVSDETLDVVEMAERISKLSDGAFDVTYYGMRGLWKFDEDLEAKLPDPAEVKRRLKLINYRDLVIDRAHHTLFLKRKGMAMNLGGIAKGYAVDRATAILKRAGYGNAIVQAGGDLMCSGSKGGAPWGAGIRDPRGGRSDVFAMLRLIDHAFSTAGDYERFFILKGKRYHHIIDPKTGYPATKSRSVTLYAPTALLADALDDAVFILGWKRGFELIDQIDEVGAVVVDAENRVHVSKRIKDKVDLLKNPSPGI